MPTPKEKVGEAQPHKAEDRDCGGSRSGGEGQTSLTSTQEAQDQGYQAEPGL